MKVQSSRTLESLQAISSDKIARRSEVSELQRQIDARLHNKPGSRLRNLQERVARESQFAKSSSISANFLNVGNQPREKSIDFKNLNQEKRPTRSSIDTIIKKSQVDELLNSINRGRSPSMGRLDHKDGVTARSSSTLLSARPASTVGRPGHAKTPIMLVKINFSRNFDSKNFFANKEKQPTLVGDWLKASKVSLKASKGSLADQKRQKISEIHKVLNISENLAGLQRPTSQLNIGKSSSQSLLSKFIASPQTAFHLNSTRSLLKTENTLYNKIASSNSRGDKRTAESTTSQLLFQNQKLFEKKKRAFMEGSLE